ncbi:chaperonin 10-like protein [Phaeosphaeriaceae sp. PMI808]|nr:chaperonin 10-like protein [Phaeosphaeriaceae sp. PMI808]
MAGPLWRQNARIEDKSFPTLLDPNDVIVRIAYVGFCGSDVHIWHSGGIGKRVNSSVGIVMGHEASGIVDAVGSAVTSCRPGDRVALEPGVPCRFCKACKSGIYTLCHTLTKYYSIAEDFVYKILDEIGLDEAVLIEPLAVSVHAIKLGGVSPGETVVIFGSGTIGLLCAAVALQFGAHRIILVDIVQNKLEFATHYLGCDTYLPSINFSAEENAVSPLKKFDPAEYGIDSFGGRVDTVIEASGAALSIETEIHVLRPGGKYVQTGLGKAKVEFPVTAMSMKELMVRGCFRYATWDYELAVSYVERRLIDVNLLISSVTKFEDATQAWDKTARRDGIKNLIQGVQD